MSEMPDRETLLRYVAEGTRVRITFTNGEGLIDEGSLPASGIIESLVFTKAWEATEGIVLHGQRTPDDSPTAFFTHESGRFHPRLTSVEPLT